MEGPVDERSNDQKRVVPNVNAKTGIRYGVISGAHVPELVDDILHFGINLREHELRELLQPHVDALLKSAASLLNTSKNDLERRLDLIETLLDIDRELSNGASSFEDGYAYQTNHASYLLVEFGGAPLVYVIESTKTVKAALCSPCIPNAIDLEHLRENGFEGYGIPDEDAETAREL